MSILKIAEKAGVSAATVSRYLNKSGYVASEKALIIQKVVEDLNYHPRVRRPGPKTADRVGIKTGVFMLLALSDYTPSKMSSDLILTQIVSGIKESLNGLNFNLINAYSDAMRPLPEQLDSRFCDGVIVFGEGNVPKLLADALQKIPVVRCYQSKENDNFDTIHYDNLKIGRLAGEYFKKRGHQHISFFNSDTNNNAYKERETGLREFCEFNGIKFNVFNNTNGSISAINRQLAMEFLAHKDDSKEKSAAFFCDDKTMLGVKYQFLDLGFGLKALDCLGCGNESAYLDLFNNMPSSIDLRLKEMGELAVKRLLTRISNPKEDIHHHLLMPHIAQGQ